MEVKVHQAFFAVKGREIQLTKSVARQFPLRHYGYMPNRGVSRETRMLQGMSYAEAICKVQARTIDRDLSGWLLLVEDEEAGLVWVRPVRVAYSNRQTVGERGGHRDVLSTIPTVIL